MMKLLKLELTKNKISTYFFATFCIFIVGLGFTFLLAYMPQIESTGDVALFNNWNEFISLISIIFIASFSVLSAVMHTKFTVEEYTGKRALLLFSYPLSRSSILFTKCSLVFVFTVIAFAVCNVGTIVIFALISNIFGIMPELFNTSMVPDLLTISGISALLSASVGLISMRVGFWKKSLVATVVTSFLLIAPFSNMLSMFPQYSSIARLIGMAVMLVIGLFIFFGLLAKVNKMEAI